ncbi:antitrypsin-like [Formica exsecta]|uniref:antitrypsin-like n=1 Tax=Formica exsecta TaxID=72781 RepID=UPI001142D057|nr:antitrypsin-like [Formica exsecta]XP_029670330.1 antitrypsin-like [Formica exsecta]
MRTALFAIIVANIVCAFDASLFEDKLLSSINKNINIFTKLSTAIVTYVELKDVSSLKEPSYINQLILKNKAYSNISLKIITTLLANGAEEGSTENELMSYLNITDKVSLNDKYLSAFAFLNSIKDNELYVETAIYVQNSVNLTADFSSLCINKLHCSISKVDFRNDLQVVETINLWVKKTTNYEIFHILTPDTIDVDTKIMLVNTVYFNIGWLNLPKAETVERIFHISPLKMYFVPIIKFEKSMFSYGEIPHWKCKFIEIPSLNDKITMIIFLPNEEMEIGDLDYLIEKFNFKAFQSVRTAYTNKLEQDIELYLPKFTIKSIQNKTNFFRRKNIITMFEDKADFTRLSKIPLKVSNIVEKVSVKIRNEMSETSEVVKRRERKSVDQPQELIVDRPFIYIIEINGKMEFIASVRAPDFIFIRDEL